MGIADRASSTCRSSTGAKLALRLRSLAFDHEPEPGYSAAAAAGHRCIRIAGGVALAAAHGGPLGGRLIVEATAHSRIRAVGGVNRAAAHGRRITAGRVGGATAYGGIRAAGVVGLAAAH